MVTKKKKATKKKVKNGHHRRIPKGHNQRSQEPSDEGENLFEAPKDFDEKSLQGAKKEVREVFDIEKKGEVVSVEKKGILKEEKVSASAKKEQIKSENKILKTILIIFGVLVLFVVAYFIYAKINTHFDYNGVKFEAAMIGDILFYETRTLAIGADGNPFGFRIRTKPSKLEKISFENLEDYELMNVNGYKYGEGSFDCEGHGVIAMPNLKRIFSIAGMTLTRDQNATCDEEGRYNFFILEYGEETEIKEIGDHCYEVVIKGNDSQCEILPATEKIMVETFVKYLNLE